MLRLRIAAAVVGVGLACTGLTMASASSAHAAANAGAAAACPADYFRIQSYDRSLFIAGNGVNNRVILTATGNCWEAINAFTAPGGIIGHEYQNGDGHCLWHNGDYLDVGAACEGGHPNEQFYGATLYAGSGWIMVSSSAACRTRAGDERRRPGWIIDGRIYSWLEF
jgi:hypothetical protein